MDQDRHLLDKVDLHLRLVEEWKRENKTRLQKLKPDVIFYLFMSKGVLCLRTQCPFIHSSGIYGPMGCTHFVVQRTLSGDPARDHIDSVQRSGPTPSLEGSSELGVYPAWG